MFFGLFKKKSEVATVTAPALEDKDKRGTLFLVDFENVHDEGLEGVDSIRAIDHVIIFYGPLIKSISLEAHLAMGRSIGYVEPLRTSRTAKNYLDFQLSTYLGYLIAQDKYENVRIISKDTGFDSVVDFWTGRGIDIKRRRTIADGIEIPIDAAVKPVEEKKQDRKPEKKNGNRSERRTEKKGDRKPENKSEIRQETKPENGDTAQNRNDGKKGRSVTLGKAAAPKIEEPKAEEIKVEEPKVEELKVEEPETEEIKAEEIKLEESKVEQIEAEESGVEVVETEEPEIEEPKVEEPKPEKSKSAEKKPAEKKSEEKKATTVPEPIKKKVRAALKDMQLAGSNYSSIYKAIATSEDKNAYHNALMKTFGNEKAGEIYKDTKAIFADYQ